MSVRLLNTVCDRLKWKYVAGTRGRLGVHSPLTKDIHIGWRSHTSRAHVCVRVAGVHVLVRPQSRWLPTLQSVSPLPNVHVRIAPPAHRHMHTQARTYRPRSFATSCRADIMVSTLPPIKILLDSASSCWGQSRNKHTATTLSGSDQRMPMRSTPATIPPPR